MTDADTPDPIAWGNGLLESYREFWQPALQYVAQETRLSEERVWQLFLVERFSSLINAYRASAEATREYMAQVKPWMDEGLKQMREEHEEEEWKRRDDEGEPKS